MRCEPPCGLLEAGDLISRLTASSRVCTISGKTGAYFYHSGSRNWCQLKVVASYVKLGLIINNLPRRLLISI